MARNRERVKLEKGAYKRALGFLKYMKPYRGTYILGLIFLTLSSLTIMLFPTLLGKLFGSELTSDDNPLTWDNLGNAWNIIRLIVVILAANAVFSFFRIYTFASVAEHSLQDLRKDVFHKLLHSKIAFFDKNKVGELSSRVATDLNSLQELIVTLLAEFIRQIITIIFCITVIVISAPQLLLTMLGVLPVVIVFIIFFGRIIRKLSKKAQDEAAASNNILNEALSGIKNVKSFGNEAFETLRYGNRVKNIKNLGIKAAMGRGGMAAFVILALLGGITIVIYQGFKLKETGEITDDEFYTFILLSGFLAASFGGLSGIIGSIQKSVGATERLLEMLENDNEELGNNILENIVPEISFNNVNFAYPTRDDVQVLKDISFDISEGETTAIVGYSGAGKSTITSLILRFYEIASGQITLGGQNIKDIPLETLRKMIAIVPQDVVLFAGSISENIAYGKVDATAEEIEAAASKANAMEFIEKFPEGMETQVGDRGIQLSGGQKQRIAIARAILKDPKILILDEATSSLDSQSEKLVQDALDSLMVNRTSIVIAHRLSTIRNADKIVVLHKGVKEEEGNHDSLTDLNGLYASLSKMQLR